VSKEEKVRKEEGRGKETKRTGTNAVADLPAGLGRGDLDDFTDDLVLLRGREDVSLFDKLEKKGEQRTPGTRGRPEGMSWSTTAESWTGGRIQERVGRTEEGGKSGTTAGGTEEGEEVSVSALNDEESSKKGSRRLEDSHCGKHPTQGPASLRTLSALPHHREVGTRKRTLMRTCPSSGFFISFCSHGRDTVSLLRATGEEGGEPRRPRIFPPFR
jgi:hypothetical protein